MARTKIRGALATLIAIAVIVTAFNTLGGGTSPDNDDDDHIVYFAASWPSKERVTIHWGVVGRTTIENDAGTFTGKQSHWDGKTIAQSGEKVKLEVIRHQNTQLPHMGCWINVPKLGLQSAAEDGKVTKHASRCMLIVDIP